MDLIETVREDLIDGLASGEAARISPAFRIERQPDGSLVAAYADDAAFIVRVERIV